MLSLYILSASFWLDNINDIEYVEYSGIFIKSKSYCFSCSIINVSWYIFSSFDENPMFIWMGSMIGFSTKYLPVLSSIYIVGSFNNGIWQLFIFSITGNFSSYFILYKKNSLLLFLK